jgi:predicted RNA binding protein YcfA (HicA-like mRNA interferase family)
MRLPRDLSGDDLVSALTSLGYVVTRQAGSHIRLVTVEHGEHHVTIPRKSNVRVGTLAAILGDVAEHFELSRDELINRLFGN